MTGPGFSSLEGPSARFYKLIYKDIASHKLGLKKKESVILVILMVGIKKHGRMLFQM